MTEEGLERAAELLVDAAQVLVSTGAGMSKESGIPTFRDAQEGLWATFDPGELATEQGFRRAPARVWSWYAYRRARMAACAPHAGHEALVQLGRLVPELVVVTQNIDGLHQRAGSPDVIELHGSIQRSRCLECQRYAYVPPQPWQGEDDLEPPSCPACGGYVRPDVVWFGEMLPEDATSRAWSLARSCDVLLVIGTSGVVWPAAELPRLAARHGARVVEINPEPSDVTPFSHVFLQGPAGVVLPRLVELVAGRRSEL